MSLFASYEWACLYRRKREYGRAKHYYLATLDGARKMAGADPTHPLLGLLLGDMAGMFREMGDTQEAEKCVREALAIARRMMPGHPLMVSPLRQLGDELCARGDFAEAEKCYREALSLARIPIGGQRRATAVLEGGLSDRFFGRDEVAIILGGLAGLLGEQGDYRQADSFYRQALEAWRKLPDGYHAALTACLFDWAACTHRSGKYAAANRLYQEALEQARRDNGDQLVLALRLRQVAAFLRDEGSYADAGRCDEECRAILRKAGNKAPPADGQSGWIAKLLLDYGEAEKAEPFLRADVALAESMRPAGHPEIAVRVEALADGLTRQGRLAEAERLYHDALHDAPGEIGRRPFYDHRDAVETGGRAARPGKNQGGSERRRRGPGRGAAAAAAADIRGWPAWPRGWRRLSGRPRLEPGGGAAAGSLSLAAAEGGRCGGRSGTVAHRSGRGGRETAEAPRQNVLREGRDRLAKALPAGSWRTAAVEAALGARLAREGPAKYPEAERFLLHGYQVLSAAHGDADGRTRRTVQPIVWLYQHWNRPQAAETFRAAAVTAKKS